MLLSSLRRMRLHLAGLGEDTLENSLKNNRIITQWLTSTSKQIEFYLNRWLTIGTYTEYFDLKYHKREFWVRATPVTGITSLYADPTGLFTGGESEITDNYIGENENSVVMYAPLTYTNKRGVRIIYTGGLANQGYSIVLTLMSIPNTAPTTGNYISNGNGSIGIVTSWDAINKNLTLENYYGSFSKGDTLTEYSDEACTTVTGMSGTVSAIYQKSICNDFPELAMACEMQTRYNIRHALDFENAGTNKDGTTFRRWRVPSSDVMVLLPEVVDLIGQYRRPAI